MVVRNPEGPARLRLSNPTPKRVASDMETTMRTDSTIEEPLQESEKRYRRLFESARDGILILDAETGEVVDVNPFLVELLGYSHDAFCGKHLWEIGAFKDIAASETAFRFLQENEYIRYEDLPLETHDGRAVDVEFVSNVYLVDGSKVIQCNIRDITVRKQSEMEHRKLLAAIEQVDESIVMTDAGGEIQFVNPAFERVTGYSREEAIGQNARILKSGKHSELFYRDLSGTLANGETWTGRIISKRKDGTFFTEEVTISPVRDTSGQIVNHVAVQKNITAQLQMEVELRQAQKMEAIGQLAGGVAHDFNNMLSVILGYVELASERVDPSGSLHGDLEEIQKAASRSAEITRQLLAFARKQTVTPVVLGLNEAVGDTLKMLRRLIGEDIKLVWLPADHLWQIKMDRGQIDQILTNLCINARNAMVGTGNIVITTGNVVMDKADCDAHAGASAGEYVLLTLADDGCGMAESVLDHIFEPFFTGADGIMGTGLGLATVYGIVKQNNGFINVRSEEGKGTTFEIYMLRCVSKPAPNGEKPVAEVPRGDDETVLVVDDEVAILRMNKTMLENLGYRVLAADTPGEAMRLADAHQGRIALLLSDVIMPEMNGRELSQRLHALSPGMTTLFMSGYPAEMLARRAVLDEGTHFIHKPFSMEALAVKVRDVLGEQ